MAKSIEFDGQSYPIPDQIETEQQARDILSSFVSGTESATFERNGDVFTFKKKSGSKGL